jgi:E1A/CREB-binding protein
MGGDITIRQVTSMDRKLEVLDRMKKRYAFRNYPSHFNYRCKCIIVFQNLDGVDVILFGMYVYEHDEKNPAPNKRVVYLSYLDSVHFMRPREMRTLIYHEILIAYLEYVRKKGFELVHIWACPPGKGDDYILYAKPENQKTPKEERLRQWYYNMLIEAQKRGIVGMVTNMYDLYFTNPKNDATCVPYLDGDYFPGEAENTIRSMEEGKHNKKSSSEKGKKKKSKSKNKGRGGTRSTGIDEEALAASGILPPGYDQKSIEEGHQDYVMAKVGEIIAPMKDNFIVAYLACASAKKENMVVPKNIAEYREKHGIRPRYEIEAEEAKKKSTEEGKLNGTKGKTAVKIEEGNGSSSARVKIEDDAVGNANGSNGDATENQAQNQVVVAREGKFAAMEARKRSIEGKVKVQVPKSSAVSSNKDKDKPSTTITVKDSKGRLVKVLDDDAEEMDCEFLNTRQLFLELCQTNNYQYDQHRRAKHSSMMVLFHLHNRDAPKFVQQCAVCAREILAGFRYHCPTCADFDLCQECKNKVEKNMIQRHQHALKKIPVVIDGKTQQTDEQRKERQRSIQLHMTLLLHAASCVSQKCQSQNCAKMKSLLKHGESCPTKHAGGCNVCKRIYTLLQIHARQCKNPNCPVPKCLAFRQRFRQLQEQQRAMDDRRRQQMNIQYHMSNS